MAKVGVVIQGRMNDATRISIKMLKKTIPLENIIISTWNSTTFQNEETFEGVEVKYNDQGVFQKFGRAFDVMNLDNILYHCFTTSTGLTHLAEKGCTHAIKIRSDEFYDIEPFVNEMLMDNTRLHSASLFFRNDFPYHIGDHLVGGSLKDMSILFGDYLTYAHSILTSPNGEIFKKEVEDRVWSKRIFTDIESDLCKLINLTNADICPEVKLTCRYILSKEKRDFLAKEHVELTKKYFKPFDIRKFNRFKFTATSVYNGISISEENIGDNGDIIIKRRECDTHPDWMLCKNCVAWALLECLIDSETRSEKDIKYLDNDLEKYLAMYFAAKKAKSTKNKVNLQNSRIKQK